MRRVADWSLSSFISSLLSGLSQALQQHQQPENSPASPLRGKALPLQTMPGKVHPVRPPQAPQALALP